MTTATACAPSHVQSGGERFSLEPACAYQLSALIDGQNQQGELRADEADEVMDAGLGLESCGGPPVDESAYVGGRLLAMNRIPRGRVRYSRDTIRIDCEVVRITLRQNEDSSIRGTVSVLVTDNQRRASGEFDVRYRWTPNTEVTVVLQRRSEQARQAVPGTR